MYLGYHLILRRIDSMSRALLDLNSNTSLSQYHPKLISLIILISIIIIFTIMTRLLEQIEPQTIAMVLVIAPMDVNIKTHE